jgi:transposase
MYRSKQIDHLGLVSGMIDELQLVELIDLQLNQDSKERDVSLGVLVKSLILNGLGFTERTLYMVSSFFEDKPIELLLGSGIKSSQLNDTSLGRCLDAIQSYGTTKLYANLVPQICKTLDLHPKYGHMDSTDFHVDGVYNSRKPPSIGGEDSQVIRLTPGYSRDHRPDLNQVVLNMIVDNQAGIPLHMQAFDGNISDKTAFHKTISDHVGNLQTTTSISHLIMDSAGYTENSLTACKDMILWISRVPETLIQCKAATSAIYENWLPLTDGYQYVPLEREQYGIKQRWLLIYSQAAYEREMITLRKNFGKKSEEEYKAFLKLCREDFESEAAAQKAVDKFRLKCKYLSIRDLEYKKTAVYEKKGRPSKTDTPVFFQYSIQGTAYTERTRFENMAYLKGKFIVATNDLDIKSLNDLSLLLAYKGQSKVESGFRFLKDPQFMASTMFVKKPERVEALLFIMTLCLTVYAALEYRIRQELEQKKETFNNQLGKPVKNPTARWIFQCFSNITILYGLEKPTILNIKPNNSKIITLLGKNYSKYYFFE